MDDKFTKMTTMVICKALLIDVTKIECGDKLERFRYQINC